MKIFIFLNMNLITSLPSEHVQKFSFPNSSEWHMRVLIQTVCLFTTASLSSTMNPMLQWLWTLPSTMMQRFQIFVFKSCCSVAKLFPTLCDPMDCSMSGFLVLHLLPFLLLSSIFPSIKVFCNELTLCIRWPKYLSFSISPSSEYSGLIPFRIDWFDLAVQGTVNQESSLALQFETSVKSLPA